MATIFDTDEDEDVSLIEIRADGRKVDTAGVSASGVVFLRGDIHHIESKKRMMTVTV